MAVPDPQGEGVLADGKVGYGQGEGFRVAKVAILAGVPGVVGDGAVGVIYQSGEPEGRMVWLRSASSTAPSQANAQTLRLLPAEPAGAST